MAKSFFRLFMNAATGAPKSKPDSSRSSRPSGGSRSSRETGSSSPTKGSKNPYRSTQNDRFNPYGNPNKK
jgi:hypothetical protein